MIARLPVRENEQPDTARRRFDGQLGVRTWATPSTELKAPDPARDPKAPWWWDGAEDASQTFLKSMGVTLA
ncbi:hypothetical protein PV729_45160 [Streptomyces europaeiscabiei]|uniref:Uncharacterized protein n=1 Tax=Streptomyces europaeiscabiei TaxID=146819 RepID=A0ABU4NVQ7_9ACTN|nr:hypothetical protein [Streptomyces europaeiscabiei]MDX2759136.1 hypothetical protein [Streptomyces europaeiscabiei]MDX3549762.1 hypothetical protein [Streptomyces europaeiscabiei]MDX3558764.1 hypothetical protein [Streptomyces europaeiscabiei]MDX3707103.1 hypothetical protein [Streptomyces europaeiscabiei]